jgi:hypothetical protein
MTCAGAERPIQKLAGPLFRVYAARLRTVEPRFPLLVVGFSGTAPGEDVMARQIEELLLLTCLGGFLAGITHAVTYAVTLLH